TRRRPAAMPAAPAPTTTTSTLPERGTGSGAGGGAGVGAGLGRGAADAGPAPKLAGDAAREERRLPRVLVRTRGGGRWPPDGKRRGHGKSLADRAAGLCRFDASSTSAATEDDDA